MAKSNKESVIFITDLKSTQNNDWHIVITQVFIGKKSSIKS